MTLVVNDTNYQFMGMDEAEAGLLCHKVTLVVNDTDYQLMEVDDAEAGRVHNTTLSDQLTGKGVFVPNNCFSRSNHYIKCSRHYLKEDIKLRKFWYFRGLRELYFLYSFGCLFAWVHMCVALGVIIVSFLFGLLFCQYMSVSCKSVRRVRKQPVIPSLESENNFIEIRRKQLSPEYVVAQNTGYGRLTSSAGMIEFQVFNLRAISLMKSAACFSIFMFLMCIIQILWGGLWLVINTSLAPGSVLESLQW